MSLFKRLFRLRANIFSSILSGTEEVSTPAFEALRAIHMRDSSGEYTLSSITTEQRWLELIIPFLAPEAESLLLRDTVPEELITVLYDAFKDLDDLIGDTHLWNFKSIEPRPLISIYADAFIYRGYKILYINQIEPRPSGDVFHLLRNPMENPDALFRNLAHFTAIPIVASHFTQVGSEILSEYETILPLSDVNLIRIRNNEELRRAYFMYIGEDEDV